MKIREIDPQSETEIKLVAQRMRQTLVEVLGQQQGEAMYSMDWLIDRVRGHLDSNNTEGRIFLSENEDGEIIGHAIARIDHGSKFGYFSTIFVEPKARNNGIAHSLVNHVESWISGRCMPKIVYNTSEKHTAILNLFKSMGYEITHSESAMVQLTKVLRPPP